MASTPKTETPIRDFEELEAEIERRKPELPKRLNQVAVYALDNPDEITFGTVASISAATNVPPSTIVRFAQYFGFDGFIGLQQMFRERLRARRSEYEERLKKRFRAQIRSFGSESEDQLIHETLTDMGERTTLRADDLPAVLSGFLEAARDSLDKMEQSVSGRGFESAVDLLAGAGTIYLLAKRRSFPVAGYMAYALGKFGVRHQLVGSAMGMDEETLGFAGPGDAALAVSFSPYTPEVVQQARSVANRGVPVVSLTDSAFSPLAEFSRIRIEVAESDFGNVRLLAASMTLAMALAAGIAEKRRLQR